MADGEIEITQSDRDAAADQYKHLSPMENMRAGRMDENGTVRAFARHRISETEALREELRKMREALNDRIIPYLENTNAIGPLIAARNLIAGDAE